MAQALASKNKDKNEVPVMNNEYTNKYANIQKYISNHGLKIENTIFSEMSDEMKKKWDVFLSKNKEHLPNGLLLKSNKFNILFPKRKELLEKSGKKDVQAFTDEIKSFVTFYADHPELLELRDKKSLRFFVNFCSEKDIAIGGVNERASYLKKSINKILETMKSNAQAVIEKGTFFSNPLTEIQPIETTGIVVKNNAVLVKARQFNSENIFDFNIFFSKQGSNIYIKGIDIVGESTDGVYVVNMPTSVKDQKNHQVSKSIIIEVKDGKVVDFSMFGAANAGVKQGEVNTVQFAKEVLGLKEPQAKIYANKKNSLDNQVFNMIKDYLYYYIYKPNKDKWENELDNKIEEINKYLKNNFAPNLSDLSKKEIIALTRASIKEKKAFIAYYSKNISELFNLKGLQKTKAEVYPSLKLELTGILIAPSKQKDKQNIPSKQKDKQNIIITLKLFSSLRELLSKLASESRFKDAINYALDFSTYYDPNKVSLENVDAKALNKAFSIIYTMAKDQTKPYLYQFEIDNLSEEQIGEFIENGAIFKYFNEHNVLLSEIQYIDKSPPKIESENASAKTRLSRLTILLDKQIEATEEDLETIKKTIKKNLRSVLNIDPSITIDINQENNMSVNKLVISFSSSVDLDKQLNLFSLLKDTNIKINKNTKLNLETTSVFSITRGITTPVVFTLGDTLGLDKDMLYPTYNSTLKQIKISIYKLKKDEEVNLVGKLKNKDLPKIKSNILSYIQKIAENYKEQFPDISKLVEIKISGNAIILNLKPGFKTLPLDFSIIFKGTKLEPSRLKTGNYKVNISTTDFSINKNSKTFNLSVNLLPQNVLPNLNQNYNVIETKTNRIMPTGQLSNDLLWVFGFDEQEANDFIVSAVSGDTNKVVSYFQTILGTDDGAQKIQTLLTNVFGKTYTTDQFQQIYSEIQNGSISNRFIYVDDDLKLHIPGTSDELGKINLIDLQGLDYDQSVLFSISKIQNQEKDKYGIGISQEVRTKNDPLYVGTNGSIDIRNTNFEVASTKAIITEGTFEDLTNQYQNTTQDVVIDLKQYAQIKEQKEKLNIPTLTLNAGFYLGRNVLNKYSLRIGAKAIFEKNLKHHNLVWDSRKSFDVYSSASFVLKKFDGSFVSLDTTAGLNWFSLNKESFVSTAYVYGGPSLIYKDIAFKLGFLGKQQAERFKPGLSASISYNGKIGVSSSVNIDNNNTTFKARLSYTFDNFANPFIYFSNR